MHLNGATQEIIGDFVTGCNLNQLSIEMLQSGLGQIGEDVANKYKDICSESFVRNKVLVSNADLSFCSFLYNFYFFSQIPGLGERHPFRVFDSLGPGGDQDKENDRPVLHFRREALDQACGHWLS